MIFRARAFIRSESDRRCARIVSSFEMYRIARCRQFERELPAKILSICGLHQDQNKISSMESLDLGMASSKSPALWHVVEVPDGWAVKDNAGATLAVVPAVDACNEADHEGMSRHEAWLLANCIASLPNILLPTARKSRWEMAQSGAELIDIRRLYASLLLN